MSKKRINHCTSKARYATLAEAQLALGHGPLTNEQLEVYRCRYCPGFHLGHVMGTSYADGKAPAEGRVQLVERSVKNTNYTGRNNGMSIVRHREHKILGREYRRQERALGD